MDPSRSFLMAAFGNTLAAEEVGRVERRTKEGWAILVLLAQVAIQRKTKRFLDSIRPKSSIPGVGISIVYGRRTIRFAITKEDWLLGLVTCYDATKDAMLVVVLVR